ncbi:MAG: hypothetical protein IT346_01815 [Epsilonproteobacteria bacterium]|nr:hypothetical protein [Campylobacterota bacterium]
MKYITFIFLLAMTAQAAVAFSGHSFMTYRSQGCNLARSNSGWFNRCTDNTASLGVEYTRSFDAKSLANYYFGCDTHTISGSRVANRESGDILADYFGLPTDFKSTIHFSPSIRNIIADIDFYWLLGDCKKWNLRINVPVVHTAWSLNPCEQVVDRGTTDYPAGYMSPNGIFRSNLAESALPALSGSTTFGDVSLPLQYGRICCGEQRLTKFSDVLIALGRSMICTSDALLDVNLQVVIPTGTRSKAITLFEPQIGNGHHWALGVGLSSRYDLFNNDSFTLSAYLDANVQHLFKTTQKRSYDLIKNGAGSRYMLLSDIANRISIAQGFSPVPAQDLFNEQYITRLFYGADATTLDSKIKIDVQADIVAKLTATYCNWGLELGYNFWARSAEKLVCREHLKHKFYGVKGDAQLYGFIDAGSFIIPVPLNTTQSEATLHAGQGKGNTTDNFVNNNADNAALVYNVSIPLAQTTTGSLINTGATVLQQVNGSDQAIVISDADINNCSGLSPRALSHKLFGAVRYEFDTCYDAQPYLLLGAEGDFSGKTHCQKTAVSQWGVWIKGGFNY